jgi:hypothetical protein
MEVENMSNKFHAPRRSWQEIGYLFGWVFVILQFYRAFVAFDGNVAVTVPTFLIMLVVFYFLPDPVEFHYWWKHRNEINHEKL